MMCLNGLASSAFLRLTKPLIMQKRALFVVPYAYELKQRSYAEKFVI